MPVKVFVPHDEQNHELPPSYAHETWGVIDLIRRLWAAYAHDPTFTVAIMANMKKPSADFVVVTNRGLGVVELKDTPGIIDLATGGHWTYAVRGDSPMKISGGSQNGRKRLNPHRQVQNYAGKIFIQARKYLFECTSANRGEKFTTNTAVCFTHPEADISLLKKNYDAYGKKKGWERFQLLVPHDIVKWVYAVSFEGNSRLHMSQSEVFGLPETIFDLTVSRAIEKALESNEPAGFLTLSENSSHIRSFSLFPGSNIIGRDPNTAVTIPVRYSYVSRHHARIVHSDQGTFVQDLGSKHHTYVDGQQVDLERPIPLTQKEHVITLCGPSGTADHVCTLVFTADLPPTAV